MQSLLQNVNWGVIIFGRNKIYKQKGDESISFKWYKIKVPNYKSKEINVLVKTDDQIYLDSGLCLIIIGLSDSPTFLISQRRKNVLLYSHLTYGICKKW